MNSKNITLQNFIKKFNFVVIIAGLGASSFSTQKTFALSNTSTTKVRQTSCAVELAVGLDKVPNFISQYRESVERNFLFNIAPLRDPNDLSKGFMKGFVVAGQGRATNDHEPRYFGQMWQRDAWIVLTVAIKMFKAEPDPLKKRVIGQHIIDVLEVEKAMLAAGDPGFTKYDEDIKPIRAWMNPQDDGPAYFLKALTYGLDDLWAHYDDLFGRNGLRTNLSKSDIYSREYWRTTSLIKTNLEYLNGRAHIEFNEDGSVKVLPAPSYEMWEEQLGLHFTNLLIQAAVLGHEYPEFTASIGDPGAGASYKETGENIEKFLIKYYWDPVAKFIRPSLFVDENTHQLTETPSENQSNLIKNHAPKISRADTQTTIGIAHGKSEVFSPASEYAMANSMYLENLFRAHYPFNHGQNVVLLGRYVEDVYDSDVRKDPNTGIPYSKGQAWFIPNFYEAELCYKRANEIYTKGTITVNANNVEYLNYSLKQTGFSQTVSEGQTIEHGDEMFSNIIISQIKRGDLINERVMTYAGQQNDPVPRTFGKYLGASWPPGQPNDTPTFATGIMGEQIDTADDGKSGIVKQTSDPSLTWTYAAYMRSLYARELAIASIKGQQATP